MRDFWEFVWFAGLVIIGFVLFFMIVFQPIIYYTHVGEIVEFKSIQTTLETARQGNYSPYEIAAIQQKVVDSNKWLANIQYWNSTILEWYIPDEVDGLKPIK